MPWHNLSNSQPDVKERIIAGLCYVTFGLVGLLYIIISGRSGQSSFFRFHFLQSIILGILGVLCNWTSSIFIGLLTGILSMFGAAFAQQAVGVVDFTLVVVIRAAYLLLGYGMLWAFLGKYAEIPFISNLVRQQMR